MVPHISVWSDMGLLPAPGEGEGASTCGCVPSIPDLVLGILREKGLGTTDGKNRLLGPLTTSPPSWAGHLRCREHGGDGGHGVTRG